MIRISVIVATRDRPAPLARCLRALEASLPDDAETIVVEDGGDAAEIDGELAASLRLRLLPGEHGGPAAARNRGLEAAAGEIVMFLDDDCVPRESWVASLAKGVRGSPPRAAGGTTLNGMPTNPYADVSQLILDLLAQIAARFHKSQNGSLRESVGFHLRLPALGAPAVSRSGTVRGARLAGLIGLWQIASLAGFVSGDWR